MGAVAIGVWPLAAAGANGALIDAVAAACRRLAPLGWRQMLMDATGGELDITAADLAAQLARPLRRIDRTAPGFGDFNLAGKRGVEPGKPDQSLLYHAFASPAVVAGRHGKLAGFPTLAEIDAVETYVYGVSPPSLEQLRAIAGDAPLAVAVFSLEYRNTQDSVHGRHAELCFSRTGIARLGTINAEWDGRARAFAPLDPARPFDFRVVPQRFAAYLAVKRKGDPKSFGPQDPQKGDEKVDFWVPLHKLYAGSECLAGMTLAPVLRRFVQNDELARFHLYLDANGFKNNWRGEDLGNYPFTIRNELIASISTDPTFGPGVVTPKPGPLAVVANYQGKPLTFPVDAGITADPSNLEFTSMQILPSTPTLSPSYMDDTAQQTQRPAPEYLSIRHRVLADGMVENLNRRPDLLQIISRGGYQAQHYYDLTGDGWVEARCGALEGKIDGWIPAYCLIAPPDFFPKVSQRDLMQWWEKDSPKPVRDALWAIPPKALSQTRIAANITLPVGFSVNDVGVTSLVTQPDNGGGPVQATNGPLERQRTGLPDNSPGIFDPGWDTSQSIYFSDPDVPLQKFLSGYGLGSPFVEDAKLCAALGAYWPAVSPDGTRTYQPNKFLNGIDYPWPTIAPLTDEEIGTAPTPSGAYMPWDGVRGPVLRISGGQTVAAYPDARRVDYLDMGTMTAALTARITLDEYISRVMAQSAAYWAVGVHDPEFYKRAKDHDDAMHKILRAKAAWAVLSFRPAKAHDAEAAEAMRAAGGRLSGPFLWRVQMFRWGVQTVDPDDIMILLVEVLEQAVVYTDGRTSLVRRDTGSWTLDSSMPTS